MKNSRLFICLIFAFFSFQNAGQTQGCCSGGTPLSGNLNLSARATPGFSFRLIYDYNNLKDLVVGTKEIADKTRARITDSGLFQANYTINKRFAVTALFSFIQQTEKIQFNTIDNESVGRGIGDIVLLAQYNIFNNIDRNLSIAGGIKAPTGSVERINADTGFPLPPDLQPGTGAWDFPTVLQFSEKNIFLNRLNFISAINYRITGEANRFDRQQRYKFGNELQTIIGFSYDAYLAKMLLTPQLNLRYRQTLFDQTDGRRTPNTGGHWIYLKPGLAFDFAKRYQFGITSDLPIYRNLDGVQLTTSFKFTVNMIYNFYKKEKSQLKGFSID